MSILIHSPQKSSVIKHLAWDNINCNLAIMFHSGTVWIYYDVDLETYDKLTSAESVGSYFNKNIRDKFESLRIGNINDTVNYRGNSFGQKEKEE